jgi:GT2 family glycosyltransferase
VDSSGDGRTREVVREICGVEYIRNLNGYGRMTASRNIGLQRATGDVIAFLDDDAFAEPAWLENLIASYGEPGVGGVGGRALNNEPDEAGIGVDEIGRLDPNGRLHGYFAADPERTVDVDHLIGCNMSFRRKVLAELGGFREDYPGISGLREDTDMCLRVRRLGYRILFNPLACVEHVGAPQAVGKRFDARYGFYASQNHCILLIRNYGILSLMLWRYLGWAIAQACGEFTRRVGGALIRGIMAVCGLMSGVARGLILLLQSGRSPIRRDADAEIIRHAIGDNLANEPLMGSNTASVTVTARAE